MSLGWHKTRAQWNRIHREMQPSPPQKVERTLDEEIVYLEKTLVNPSFSKAVKAIARSQLAKATARRDVRNVLAAERAPNE